MVGRIIWRRPNCTDVGKSLVRGQVSVSASVFGTGDVFQVIFWNEYWFIYTLY